MQALGRLFATPSAASTSSCVPAGRRTAVRVCAHKVKIATKSGEVRELEVPDGTTILEAALDAGLDVSHDCKMGVCMTCPAKMVSGSVNQSAGMLSEDVQQQGYVLLCVAQPLGDCEIREIEEEELLDVQLA